MNYGEGRLARSRMEASGYTFVSSPEDADVLLLNTCGVIGLTENSMMRRIGELGALGKQLLVTGCLAPLREREIRLASPGAMVFAPSDFQALDSMLNLKIGRDMDCWNDATSNDIIVPVQQGCLSLCTYCFSRLARGNVRSIRPERVLSMIRSSISPGTTREIMLSGMDTITYGRDIGTTLPELLRSISALEGDFRVRVGMMNPSLLTPLLDELLDAFSDPRIYRFFHIPFQSGSEGVLKRMKRGNTASRFLEIVARVRERYPDMTLSTDIIVGFPGESEDDFDRSLEVMSEARPDIVNVTRFSARPGTPASVMDGQVPGWVMKERSRRATALRFSISAGRNISYVGRRVQVLATERGKNGFTIGRLQNYRQAIIRGEHMPGQMVDCAVTGYSPVHLVCEPLIREVAPRQASNKA